MKYHIFTTGCQQNVYDSERITHLLDLPAQAGRMGCLLVDEDQADLIVVLACSVRQKPVDRIWGKLRLWRNQRPRPRIIVTGCLLPADKVKMLPKIDAFIPADRLEKDFLRVLSRLEVARSRRSIRRLERARRYNERSDRTLSASFVPIIYGCDNFCTYCAVPYTRGRERSRPMDEIICEIKKLIKNGLKEVTLLGQNVNAYYHTAKYSSRKKERKIDFVGLLKEIEKIEGLEKISFLTSHPRDMSDDLIEWMARSKKFSREIHLPLQSGDDEILRRMNRGYTSAQYLRLIENCKLKIPASPAGGKNLRLTTDIIVGFPNETKQQFKNTYKLCQKIGFDGAYIAQYSPRPGTISAKMKDDVSPKEKKRRWRILDELINKKR